MTTDARADFEAFLDYPSLIRGGRVAANWMADGRFWFTEGAPEHRAINTFDPKTGAVTPLFDTAKVRQAYRTALGREAPWNGLPFEAVRPDADGTFVVAIDGRDYALAADGTSLTALPRPGMVDVAMGAATRNHPETFVRPTLFPDSSPTPEMLSPDGRWYASIRDHDIWLRSPEHGRRERLTFDGEALNGWDVESVRMGVGAGMQLVVLTTNPWSPTGYKLFVTRLDERGVEPFVRVRWNGRSDEIEHAHFARAGERLPTTTPYVLDVMRRTTVRIDVPVEERFLLLVGWSADGTAITFVQFSRDMSWAGVWRADARTGQARLLYEETSDTFLRIQHETIGGRSGCTLLPDGGFLWESNRDGFDHLYLHDADGKPVRQLTSGGWPVVDVQAVDQVGGFVYFTAHHDQERPYDVHLCRIPLNGGEVERLTDGAGVHEIQLSPDRSCFVDTVSRPDLPPRSVVRSASGEVVHRFPEPDISALEALGWLPPEQVSVKAADGETDLWAVVYKPRGFDPARSYPVIEYIYGGPQVSVAPHHFPLMPMRMYSMNQALPLLGYVVVMLDARGTPERSKAFQDATYKEWRRHVTADHAAGIRNLAKDRPWMDLDRVGIWGHSWGGYFTVANMFDNPELYRAGVCSAPGFDPYDAFIYEPYLGGVPSADNRAAYEDANLLNDAARLQGELMMAAGTNDMGVWQSAVRMTDALIRAGRRHELVPLPGQHHGYASAYETYFIEKLLGHFERTLKSEEKQA